MARYRLRFVLREVDLMQGVTTIGRGLDCHVTLDDPLVSRHHARIVVDDEGAAIEDAGSRNGVSVNGAALRAPTPLRDGDRVRLGLQEFVFCQAGAAAEAPPAKRTGELCVCANCGQHYPREMIACPQCEETELAADDTWPDHGRRRLRRGFWFTLACPGASLG